MHAFAYATTISKIPVLQLSRTLRSQQSGIDLRLFWTTTLKVFSLSFRTFLFSFIYFASFTCCSKRYTGCNKSTKETGVKIMIPHAIARTLNYYESKIITLESYKYNSPTFLATMNINSLSIFILLIKHCIRETK